MLSKILLIGTEHAIQPWKEFLRAVVSVKHDWDPISRGNGADVMGGRNGTLNGRKLASVGDTLAGKVGSASLGHLNDDRRLRIAGSLERGNDG